MCHKPTRAEGQAKLERWANERREHQRTASANGPSTTGENTHPRGNPDPDQRDLERGIERLEAMLGR